MLGGLDPVIIFQFSALAPVLSPVIERIPLVSQSPSLIAMPPIPVYLSEKIFKVAIGGVTKSVDIATDTQGKTDGSSPDVNQSPIQSSLEVQIEAKADSVPLTLLSSLIDQVYERASAKTYSISFLYGATTIFNAVLQGYQVQNVEGTDKIMITVKLSKGDKNPVKPAGVPSVPGVTGDIPVGAA